jgi:hypothetical protein
VGQEAAQWAHVAAALPVPQAVVMLVLHGVTLPVHRVTALLVIHEELRRASQKRGHAWNRGTTPVLVPALVRIGSLPLET